MLQAAGLSRESDLQKLKDLVRRDDERTERKWIKKFLKIKLSSLFKSHWSSNEWTSKIFKCDRTTVTVESLERPSWHYQELGYEWWNEWVFFANSNDNGPTKITNSSKLYLISGRFLRRISCLSRFFVRILSKKFAKTDSK